ncbi:MAG: formyltransferase [Deltaproteobacteria bacterium]|nr:formyltransferase [Deltaproteobacteria bacterium]
MRIAVFGYHSVGYECLKVLLDAGDEIVAVVTHEDDPNEEIWFPSVAVLARKHRLPVHTPSNPNLPAFVELIRSLAPDIVFSFYYRRIFSRELLAIPRLGAMNLHGSLLPKYRGRSPVNWVLVNGEKETGVTLHYMVETADAGDIIAQRRVSIDLEDTGLSLFRKITAAAAELLRETLPLIRSGTAPRISQDSSQATKFGGRHPEDGKIAWEAPALSIYNLIRAVTHPYPGAFTFHHGRKLYIWTAALDGARISTGGRQAPGTIEAVEKGKGMIVSTSDGVLLVTRVQFEGEKETAADELSGHHGLAVGARLGE